MSENIFQLAHMSALTKGLGRRVARHDADVDAEVPADLSSHPAVDSTAHRAPAAPTATSSSPSAASSSFGTSPTSMPIADVGRQQWRLLCEEISLPVAVLLASRIEHNLQWMQTFIDRYGVKLAPHGKTTMSPALFQQQIDHGAWGITLANAPQTEAAFAHGIRRVLMANQLVGRANMAIIADLQAADARFDFYCTVDSADNVDALGAYFEMKGQRLQVLLEYGPMGGRTGVRDAAQEAEVLQAIRRWPASLVLAGVEIYEGVLAKEPDVRAFLQRAREGAERIAAAGGFARARPILTGAGSAWYDVVADEWTARDGARQFEIVLRPGCYLTHDVGAYRQANERILADNRIARDMHRSLLPALQVWAYVQSRPEPTKAIIAMGKRDTAFDAGFPEASLHFRPQAAHTASTGADTDAFVMRGDTAGEGQINAPIDITLDPSAWTGLSAPPVPAPGDWTITAMMDQHAFMSVPPDADLRVGDMIAFDICHPCLTFDKWRHLLLVDDDYRVTGAVATFF